MPVPRLLLLTGHPPNLSGVGGIFLHDLCIHYPKQSLFCFAICRSIHQAPLPQDLDWLSIMYGRLPRQAMVYGGIRRIHKIGLQRFQRLARDFARLGSFFTWHYARTRIPDLVEKAVQFGKKHGVEMVCAQLYYPVMSYVARRVASELGVDLVTIVWDPPEYILSSSLCFDWFSRSRVLKEFQRTLQFSVRCGVASQEMQREYENIHNVKSVVMIHGIHPDMRKPPKKEPASVDRFVIAFAGNLYAVREWQILLSALDSLGWRINGRQVKIILLGNHDEFLYSDKKHVEYLGFRPIGEAIDLMSRADIAYLPYWFDESYRLATRLCFPNKITTYLAAGIPILFHGPEYSSVTSFFRRFHVGLCCNSLEQSVIIECLRRFIVDKDLYSGATAAGQEALDQELDLRVFLKRFAELIGIEPDNFMIN